MDVSWDPSDVGAPPQPWQRVPVAAVPPPGYAPEARRRVGATGYAVGAGILVLGMLVALVWIVKISLPDTSGFVRVPVPSDRQVELQARPYTLYDEYPTSSDASRRTPTVRISGPNGVEPVVLAPVDNNNTYYTADSRFARAIGSVNPTVAGTYRVTVGAEPVPGEAQGVEQVAMGDDLLARDMGGFVAAALIGLVSFVAGFTVIVITAVRRSRSRSGGPDTPTRLAPQDVVRS